MGKRGMKNFIIINGSMGAGKTTVGKRICDMLGRSAFIDGDWCLNIHPFIGNRETVYMAVDNILHMAKNYCNCSECDYVVLSWIMSENTINKIILGLSDINFKIHSVILTCGEETLIDRWKQDSITEWRNGENLNIALKSINDFNKRTDGVLIDTSNLSVDGVADKVIKKINLNGSAS